MKVLTWGTAVMASEEIPDVESCICVDVVGCMVVVGCFVCLVAYRSSNTLGNR